MEIFNEVLKLITCIANVDILMELTMEVGRDIIQTIVGFFVGDSGGYRNLDGGGNKRSGASGLVDHDHRRLGGLHAILRSAEGSLRDVREKRRVWRQRHRSYDLRGERSM